MFDRFLPYKAMTEICQNFDWFLGDLKTPKFHSEINRPLRFDTLNRLDDHPIGPATRCIILKIVRFQGALGPHALTQLLPVLNPFGFGLKVS